MKNKKKLKKNFSDKNRISLRKSFYAFLMLVTILLVFLTFTNTFSVFHTEGIAVVNQEVGKWIIKINDTDISKVSNKSFSIDNFNYSNSTKVEDGMIAPGRSGYFDVIVDPSGTDVSVLYNIEFDFGESSVLSSSVAVLNGDGIIKTGPNKYSGIIKLSDIENNVTNTLRVYIDWINDENNNESDTIIGETQKYISIPVNISAVQYTGEVLVPYSE